MHLRILISKIHWYNWILDILFIQTRCIIGHCMAHQCIHVYIQRTFLFVTCTIFIIFTTPWKRLFVSQNMSEFGKI